MSRSKQINLWGGLALAGYIIHSVLSWFIAAGIGATPSAGPRRREFFDELGELFTWAPSWLHEAISNGGPFQDFNVLVTWYSVPLVLQTVCFAATLWMVHGTEGSVLAGEDAGRRIRRWAIAFAIVSVVAFDVMTPDIWLGVPWGRMILSGHDPYLIPYYEGMTAGTCVDIKPLRMTYGPVWALVSAGAVFLSGDVPIVTWLILKLVLLGSWIGCLTIVGRMSKPLGAKRHATAMLIMGWLPVGVHNIVAEGHNDGLMVVFLLLWLQSLTSTTSRGPLYLASSVFTKFAVAPVAIVDAVFQLRPGGMSFRRYVLRGIPSLIVGLPVLFFILSDGRLDEATSMRWWRFLEPYDVLLGLQKCFGIYIPYKSWFLRLVFGVIAALALFSLWRKPVAEHAWFAAMAVLSAVMFSWLGHVWPWFYVWLLPFAALLPNRLLSIFIIGASIVAPFSIFTVWSVSNIGDGSSIPASFAVYGTAIGLVAIAARYKWRFD